MATVTVYNRDGTEYGTLDTSKYVFNNDLIGLEPEKLDINMYPYVKINGTYYVNDGEEFQSVGRTDNSAALMSISDTYLYQNNNILDSCLIRLLPNGANNTKAKIEFLQEALKKTGTIDIKNYNIDGKSIQGLCFDTNYDSTAPYRHGYRQPMLPISNNMYADRFYWDMYPSQSNFFLASNFNQDTSENHIYKLTTDDEYIYLYSTPVFGQFSNEESLIGKIRKEWVPYISLAVKSTDSSYGSLPVYSHSSMVSYWDISFKPNRFIFNIDGLPANGNPISLSMHLIGNKADEQHYSTDNPIDIDIIQNTSLKFLTMKVYENFEIWLSKEKCNINGKEYEWVDNVFVNNSNLKNLFISRDYNSFLGIFKSENNTSFEWDIGGKSGAVISELGNTLNTKNYPVSKFFGYKVYLKGTDYQIETNQPIFKILQKNQPQHNSFTVDDVYVNDTSIKEGASSSYTWKGCSVNILKWIFSLQGKCGTICENLSILSPNGYKDPDAGESLGLNGFSSIKFPDNEHQYYNDDSYNYWVSGRYKYENPWAWEHNSFYSLACANIGFKTPKNYGWAILGHSEIYIPIENPYAVTLILESNQGNKKLLRYKVSNQIGYKIQISISVNNIEKEEYILPFGEKDFDFYVPVEYSGNPDIIYSIIN